MFLQLKANPFKQNKEAERLMNIVKITVFKD